MEVENGQMEQTDHAGIDADLANKIKVVGFFSPFFFQYLGCQQENHILSSRFDPFTILSARGSLSKDCLFASIPAWRPAYGNIPTICF